MEPLQTMSVGDVITVYREDRDGSRIPTEERDYTTEKDYSYLAKVIKLCPEKKYNLVQVINSDGTVLTTKRRAYKSKCYALQTE